VTRVYYMDDFTIDVPEGFRDRAVHLLEWRTDKGDPIALVAQRDDLPSLGPDDATPPSVLFARYVSQATKDYPIQLAGYREEHSEVSVPSEGSLEMRRVAFRWKKDQDVLYDHQAFVLAGRKVLLLTCTGKARDRDAVDLILNGALERVRVRAD
jgi:hypothetical protein